MCVRETVTGLYDYTQFYLHIEFDQVMYRLRGKKARIKARITPYKIHTGLYDFYTGETNLEGKRNEMATICSQKVKNLLMPKRNTGRQFVLICHRTETTCATELGKHGIDKTAGREDGHSSGRFVLTGVSVRRYDKEKTTEETPWIRRRRYVGMHGRFRLS